jgi:hypothetical protein
MATGNPIEPSHPSQKNLARNNFGLSMGERRGSRNVPEIRGNPEVPAALPQDKAPSLPQGSKTAKFRHLPDWPMIEADRWN